MSTAIAAAPVADLEPERTEDAPVTPQDLELMSTIARLRRRCEDRLLVARKRVAQVEILIKNGRTP